MIYTYSIPLPPLPWKRPGLNGKRFFDGQQRDKVLSRLHLEKQHRSKPLLKSPIKLEVIFYLLPPRDKSRKGIYDIHPHQNKPDIDNLCKFLLDTIQGSIISDDKIICSLNAIKKYDLNPRTEFTIEEIKNV